MKLEPKKYYSYVQSKGTTREEMGPLIVDGNRLITENREKVEAFCTYFRSVLRADTAISPTSHHAPAATVGDLDITEDQVLKVLKGLQASKAPGPDGIHPAIIKPIADIIAGPICRLYQMSLDQGRLPSDWKTAAVVALHKGGAKTDFKNYRPVSLTSVVCKTLEKIVKSHLVVHLEQYKLMSETQHGFTKQRSCLTNLLCFLEEVTSKLDENKTVEVAYLDFSKAFDSVNQRLLLFKLKNFGIQGQLHNWISAFLSRRSFFVRVGEECSAPVQLISGVPQGSVLGPLLFLLYINDLPNTLKSSCYIFADDVKVVGSNGREDLERDLLEVAQWARTWDLSLNASKSHVLTGANNRLEVNTGGDHLIIEPVRQVRDLGITITSSLTWADQCALAARKARGELFKLRSVLSCKRPEVFLTYYKAIVRPHLEYCIQAWSPFFKKDAACLEKVQRLATKMIEGQRGKTYIVRPNSLGLFSLERRRLRGDMIETFKIMKGFTGIKIGDLFTETLESRTRGHTCKLLKKRCRLNLRKYFFSNRVINGWNSLPRELVGLESVHTFKAALDAKWLDLFPDIDA